MNRKLLTLSLALALFVSGCTYGLRQGQVRKDFLKEHPTYKIISVGDGDGNDTTYLSFFIRYTKPGDEREYWTDWSYDTKDGKFEFASKGDENIFSEKAHP